MSTNVSKQKRDDLVEKIKLIKNFITNSSCQDENAIQLLSYINEIEKDLKSKKYGLIYEEHCENIDKLLNDNIPVLTEKNEFFIDNGGKLNFLIEGDNLASLSLLNKTHKRKIDFIYIDPPYNTGNKDFMYDDVFVCSDDLFRHSKWSSFILKRLNLARELLSEDGFICISIDDNEYAVLKLLCDEVFGEHNYLSTFHIQVRYAEKSLNEEKPFKPLMEYVLFYAKNNEKFKPKRETVEYGLENFCFKITELSEGTYIENNGKPFIVYKPTEWKIEKVEGSLKGLKETWVTGSIYTTMSYGKVFQSVVEPRISIDGLGCLYKVLGRGDDGLGYRYYTGPAKKNATKGKMYSGVPLERVREFENGNIPVRELPILTVHDYSPDFGNIRSEGGVPFGSGKKPIKMIKQFLNYHLKKDALVLDFFAGSGSTGHAVINLNNEDGGNRRFILCTNNENNICEEITYKRLKNVILKEGNASLKYFKVDYVPITDKLYYEYADELLRHIKELVELENGINFNGNNEISIILTEEELEEFVSNYTESSLCKSIYLGHDVLPSYEHEQLFISKGIKVNIIPDYYYKELEG